MLPWKVFAIISEKRLTLCDARLVFRLHVMSAQALGRVRSAVLRESLSVLDTVSTLSP